MQKSLVLWIMIPIYFMYIFWKFRISTFAFFFKLKKLYVRQNSGMMSWWFRHRVELYLVILEIHILKFEHAEKEGIFFLVKKTFSSKNLLSYSFPKSHLKKKLNPILRFLTYKWRIVGFFSLVSLMKKNPK